MGEKQKKKAKELIPLDEAFYEPDALEHLIEYYLHLDGLDSNVQPDFSLLLLLAKAVREKIRYFQEKYDFKVEEADLFNVEDYADFIRRSEGISGKSSVEKME